MPSFKTLDDLASTQKRILIRVDVNVPMEDGTIIDQTRLQKICPTIQEVLSKGKEVILLAHLGRPHGNDLTLSLQPIAHALEAILKRPIYFHKDLSSPLPHHPVSMLENLRFEEREEANSEDFAKLLASFGDAYVNDAFSVSHRAHASVEAITHFLPSYAGRLFQDEVEALTQCLQSPTRPLMALVGGAKISTKIDLLYNLIDRVDVLVLAGGIANTFLMAQGVNMQKSLMEPDKVKIAQEILKKAKTNNCRLLLPVDGLVAESPNHLPQILQIDNLPAGTMALDFGPRTLDIILDCLKDCRTLVWNGPLGLFEKPPYDQGTIRFAKAVAAQTRQGNLLSIAGGGETVAAISQAGVAQDLTYLSTAGGAFLEWLEGKKLPGIIALEKAA